MLTRAACRLVRPEAFGYFGIRTWTTEFAVRGDVHVPHIQLARLADLVLILYATARTLFRLACGDTSDLLSLIVAATHAPVVVVPSMNQAMWDHAPVQRNVARLRDDGVYVVEPSLGHESAEGQSAQLMYGAAGFSRQSLQPALTEILHTSRKGLEDKPDRV